jgi:NhaP-type Na+/H+ or K+/H+ antiporter
MKKIRISYSVIYTLLGFILYSLISDLPPSDPEVEESITLRLTELVVIISLMGAGLKIDKPFSLRGWSVPLRLVSVTMILAILFTTALGYYWLEFSLPTALLLGAALAPTDPVLASDVQVGPPNQENRSEVRFSLTAEGGLNDGMAFPFVWLAILLAMNGENVQEDITIWFLRDFLYKILAGVACGIIMGKALSYVIFRLPEKTSLATPEDGFIALSATLLIYGLTELLHGYGFVAVFVTAVTLRHSEAKHEFHLKMHSFMDQIERILVAMVLILLGGSVAGGILSPLKLDYILFGLAMILIIRPLCAYGSLFRTKFSRRQKTVISFFGIKGVGSLFYLAFGTEQTAFGDTEEMWAIVSFIVLCSILIHGLTATRSLESIDRQEDNDL